MRIHEWTLALGTLLAAGCAGAETTAPGGSAATAQDTATATLVVDGMS
ncbi:MAG: hypothetical protein ACYTGX_13330 [Planctomycetota bacterium]|jgi:hypothetical protein